MILPRPLTSLVGTLGALLLLGAAACGPIGLTTLRSAVPAAVEGVTPDGPNVAIAAQAVQQVGVQQTADVPPGRILYVRDGNLWLWQGGTSRQFSEGGTWFQPAFSPDGKDVAYVYWTFNFSDVFVMASDGTKPQRLTRGQSSSLADSSWAFRPVWSPDGTRLAYTSDANSWFPQVWIMARDGTARRQISVSTFEQDSWVDMLSWDPSGNRLAVTAAPNIRDSSQIYLIDVAKGTSEKLTTHANGAFDPSFSPDGATIAYIGRSAPQGELWVRSLDGSLQAHTDRLPNVRSPSWSPDGRSLAVLAPQNGAFEIFIFSLRKTASGYELGEPRQLTRDAAVDPMSGLTWAP